MQPGIGSGCQSGLLQFKTAVWIVTITALDHSFKHFVMKRLVEVRLDLVVTTHTKLRLANFQ
jgi:hypothetical protein